MLGSMHHCVFRLVCAKTDAMRQKASLRFATAQHPEEAHAGNGTMSMPLRRQMPRTHSCPLLEKTLKVWHVLGKPLAVQLLPDVFVGVPPRPLCLQPTPGPGLSALLPLTWTC